jgi:hypothetical protein
MGQPLSRERWRTAARITRCCSPRGSGRPNASHWWLRKMSRRPDAGAKKLRASATVSSTLCERPVSRTLSN